MNSIDRQIIATLGRNYVRNMKEKWRTGLYPLRVLYYFVTMRCNACCEHCFCWEDLNVGIPELTIEQVRKLASTAPPISILCLTGGEPMLRRDLAEVLEAFAATGRTREIKVNSNGLDADKVEALAVRFKEQFPHVGLAFQISVDGLEETHDRIRGVPGCFRKLIHTMQVVRDLGRKYPALAVDAFTVVTAKNYREIVPLHEYIQKHVGPKVPHGFELVRDVDRTAWNIDPAVKEKGVGPKVFEMPPFEAFDEIRESLEEVHRRGAWRVSPFHLHSVASLEMLRTGKRDYPCAVAGEAVGVLYANGDVAACEFTKPFANLSAFDFDFGAAWHSAAAEERRKQIKCCHCIHGSFHTASIMYSLGGIVRSAALGLGKG